MVKKAKEEKLVKTSEEILAENKQLREAMDKIALTPSGGDTLSRYMGELSKIAKKATVSAGKIEVHEIADHKNISLWTKYGKRIGPLARSNAERTFQAFFELGIELSVDKPTPEQIEAYKQTDEYKKYAERIAVDRKRKEKSKRSGQMQKLAEEIAKMSGTTIDAINHILKANEIKPLAEGRK